MRNNYMVKGFVNGSPVYGMRDTKQRAINAANHAWTRHSGNRADFITITNVKTGKVIVVLEANEPDPVAS